MGTELRTYLRDLTTGEWITYTPDVWLGQYQARIDDALVRHGHTVGGSFAITGSPETGRMTVCAVDGAVVLDFDWHTMTIEQARAQQNRHSL